MHDNFFKTAVSPVSGVGNLFFLVPPLCLGPGYFCVLFDLNPNSFAIPFCLSAEGLVKMTTLSRVLAKSKPKTWIKCNKVCNFIAVLSSRNVWEDFRIKLFKNRLCLCGKIFVSIMHVD